MIVNFKAYSEGIRKGEEIALAAREINENREVFVAIAPDFIQLKSLVEFAPVFAQHTDAVNPGSSTGRITPEMVKASGATGSLINHSERPLILSDIEFLIRAFRELELTSVVCTNNIPISKAVAALTPDFIAIEPPELIGTGIPVSKADPGIVEGAVKAVQKVDRNIMVLCGAGISEYEDFVAALDLGAKGVLLASGVVKAKNPGMKLKELVGI